MQTISIARDYFSLIAVTGEDSTRFLQGQLTCDVNQLSQHGTFGACCDQKGRIVWNFFVFEQKGSHYFLLPKSMLTIALSHFKKYALFSKVHFATQDNVNTIEYKGTEIDLKVLEENRWRLHNINMGFVWIYPETKTLFIPQMINLGYWGALSFNKGCYLGQEIVTRSEYLGQVKRHLYHVCLMSHNRPQVGNEIKNQDDQPTGIIVEVAEQEGYELLAVIQDRTITDSLFFGKEKIIISNAIKEIK